jgi:class 3 adenylate cyclase/tetratricopeptide (TPR) repeat protein
VRTCSNCGRQSPESYEFCPHCGTPFEAAPRAAQERKVVSVLFADLVGFTARSDRSDPEDVRAALAPYHARVKKEIERFGGTVEKFIGDAVMAAFGAPVAHEDDAERAVRSALRIPDAIAELNEATPGLELAVRVAVNTGEALVSLGARPEAGESIVAGDVVNTASRLQQVAPVGGVVVGEMTHRATRHVIDYEELEPVVVKGKAEPVPVWRALEARSRYGVDWEGVRAPLIGREDDLALLKQTYARTLRESSVQLVTIVGEPGVGKTRLVREFFTHVDDQPGLTYWRQGRCLAYGENITFWALGEIVKAQAGIFESDRPDQASQKLAGAVEAVIEDPSEREWVTARLAPLVAIGAEPAGGEESREESFAAWRRFLEAVASMHPLVLVVEDLHWADPALFAFLEHLVEWAVDVPLMVVCTARPELFEAQPGWGGGKRNSTTISLSPLSDQETARLIAALLEQAVLPATTQAGLLERAGGNPLYAEEFVRMLVDRGIFVRAERAWQIDPEAEIPVPETVQSLIAARIDTLGPDRKALVHDAAVIGKVFWPGALAAMGGREEGAVLEGLHDLTRQELVRRDRRSSVEGQVEHAFWHALIRDVAYGQIPRAGRAAKHQAAARWIEGLGGDRVTDHAEFLAHHYGQALELARAAGSPGDGEVEELEDQARRFLVMAGDRAAGLDSARAVDLFHRALALFPDDHPERPSVLVRAADAAFGVLPLFEFERTYEEAIEAFRRQGDAGGAGEAMAKLSTVVWGLGDSARAMELVVEAVRLLEPEGPGPRLAHAYAALGARLVLAGRPQESLPWVERALELAVPLDLPAVASRAHQARGMARCSLGDLEGMADLREGVRLGHDSGNSQETSNAYLNLSFFQWLTEGPAVALATHREAIEFCIRRGRHGQRDWVVGETCWFLFDLGEWNEVLDVAGEVGAFDFQMGLSALAHAALVGAMRGEPWTPAQAEEGFLARGREMSDPQITIPALGIAVVIEHVAGRAASARPLLEELLRAQRHMALDPTWYLPEAVRACVAGGHIALAERFLTGLQPRLTRDRHAIAAASAELAEGRGALDEAAHGHQQAAGRWAVFGIVHQRGWSLLGLGRCLVALGRGAEATAALRDARDVFAPLGARPLLEETDAWLAKATALSS